MTPKAHAHALAGDDCPASPAAPSRTAAYLLRSWPHFRGKTRLQDWFVPHSGIARASIFGLEMELDLADLIQRDMYAGLYEPFETQHIRKFLGPGMTVVDVGANVGYYTWMAANAVGPTGKVLAVQPGPYAFERLQRVIRANQLRHVQCRNLALSDTSGRATLYVPKQAEGNYNPSLSPYLPDMDPVDVKIARLDDVLDEAKIGGVDLMKVDVEGHELNVFKGAGKSIREGRIRAILCEFNEGYQAGAGWSCGQLEQWFEDSGFVLSQQFPSKWGSRVHNRLYVLPV